MFTILLHSSKTMRSSQLADAPYQAPALLTEATTLAKYIQSLSLKQIAVSMHISPKMAAKTQLVMQAWNTEPHQQQPAIDAFLGDIYSGLQVQSLTTADRAYANEHLLILSGLYGALRALDGIAPYRMEMGYRFPAKRYANLYTHWGERIAKIIDSNRTIINLSAVEYTKAVLPHIPDARVITPKFMTMNAAGVPTFVTVHAKVARGAFAHWLIKNRVANELDLQHFKDLSYSYNAVVSTPEAPVFVCKTFGGIGLSVRLN